MQHILDIANQQTLFGTHTYAACVKLKSLHQCPRRGVLMCSRVAGVIAAVDVVRCGMMHAVGALRLHFATGVVAPALAQLRAALTAARTVEQVIPLKTPLVLPAEYRHSLTKPFCSWIS